MQQLPGQTQGQLPFVAPLARLPGLPQGQLAGNMMLAPQQLLQQQQQQQQQQQLVQAAAVQAAQAVQAQAIAAGAAAQQAALQKTFKGTEVVPAVRRYKKRKLPDRTLPEKVAHIIPESLAFSKLLEYQRRVDDKIQHMRSYIKEAVSSPEHVKKRLRLYVYNTHMHQKPAPSKAGPSEPPSWCLVLAGRILDPETHHTSTAGASLPPVPPLPGQVLQPAPSATHATQAHKHPMTFYLRRVDIRLDPAQYAGPSGNLIWEKAAHNGPFKDALEVRRKGSQDVSVSISIEPDWQPEKWQLPQPLAALLGVQYESKARIMSMLWAYFKSQKLQDPKQPSNVNLTPELAQIFGTKMLAMQSLADRLHPLLARVPPLTIHYTIRVSGSNPSAPAVYDIDVELPVSQPTDKIAAFVDRLSKDRELEVWDQQISTRLKELNECKRRRAFYLGFSHSPVDFINALIASQSRDLRMARGVNGRDFDVDHRTDTFKQKWVEEAVLRLLHKRSAAGH